MEDRLSKDNREIEKIEYIKNTKALDIKRQCPFKPQIGKTSMKIYNNKIRVSSNMDSFNSIGSKFDFLFEDSKRRKLYKENLLEFSRNDECTFKPNIDTNNYFSSAKETKVKKPRIADIMVNQPSYRPKTGRGPRTHRNQEGKNIGDYLYSQSKIRERSLYNLKTNEVIKDKLLRNKSYH